MPTVAALNFDFDGRGGGGKDSGVSTFIKLPGSEGLHDYLAVVEPRFTDI
jgi:hypothetical protein